MTPWQDFFKDYLDYLGVPYNAAPDLLTTYTIDGENTQKTQYCFTKKDHKPGVLGFYPGTNFFYNILEGCLQRGAFLTAYLTGNRFVTSKDPFVPYLYMYVQVVSPAINTPRKNYSLMVNMQNGIVLLDPALKGFRQLEKGQVKPQTLSYKDAFQNVLDYIKEDLTSEKDWLLENQKSRDVYLRNVKKAGLSKSEEEARITEAKARLSPHFEVQVKLLARLYIK